MPGCSRDVYAPWVGRPSNPYAGRLSSALRSFEGRVNPVTPMPVALTPLPPVRPHAAAPPSYLVGQDGEGHWVAVAAGGRAGGIFRTRQDAIRYACIETGCRPDDVRLAADPIAFRLT